jgi:hypothetical protein
MLVEHASLQSSLKFSVLVLEKGIWKNHLQFVFVKNKQILLDAFFNSQEGLSTWQAHYIDPAVNGTLNG